MKTQSLIPILLGCALAGAQGQKPADQSPLILTCKTVGEKFNNIERIPIEVRLTSRDIDVDRAEVNPANPPSRGVSYLEIVVEEPSAKGKSAVAVKITRSGQGRDLDESYAHFELEIPIDAAVRREKIVKHLDDLVREAKNKSADPKLLKLYEDQKSREGLMATFEKIYVQNRVGTFVLGCRFFPNQENSALTPVQSSKEMLSIDFKSDFLDQPAFH